MLSRLRHTPITGCPAAPCLERAQVVRSLSKLGSDCIGPQSQNAFKPLFIRLRDAVVFRDRACPVTRAISIVAGLTPPCSSGPPPRQLQ